MNTLVRIFFLVSIAMPGTAMADFESELARHDGLFFQKSFNECDFDYLDLEECDDDFPALPLRCGLSADAH